MCAAMCADDRQPPGGVAVAGPARKVTEFNASRALPPAPAPAHCCRRRRAATGLNQSLVVVYPKKLNSLTHASQLRLTPPTNNIDDERVTFEQKHYVITQRTRDNHRN